MNCIFRKTEIINGNAANFLIVESFKPEERIEKVREELLDDSWISRFSEALKLSYHQRLEETLTNFEKNVKEHNDDILSYIGEKIVTICSANAIDEQLHFIKLPLGDIFKSRTSGNGGFDYYNENRNDFCIVFGEGKYVNGINAYNKALKQIEDFIFERRDVNDIADISPFIKKQTETNFVNGRKSFSAGYSYYSKKERADEIIKNIKENEHFIKLIKDYDLIVVGVLFND